MTTPEVRLNHTIYINNLNEKIKKVGKMISEALLHVRHEANVLLKKTPPKLSIYFFCSCRVEKIPLRHFLTIRTNLGHPGRQEPKDEGAGVCYFQRGQQCVQCFEIYAGLPFLRQTHGRFMETAFFFHVKHTIA